MKRGSFLCTEVFRTLTCFLPKALQDRFFSRFSHFGTLEAAFQRGVVRKRCSENMQQIYKKTLMPKCDFNKVKKLICCIFSEHLFIRTPMEGCFCNIQYCPIVQSLVRYCTLKMWVKCISQCFF